VRTIAIITAAGIVLGVALAFVLHALRKPARTPTLLPCSAEWLHLAPTVGLDPTGKVAQVGFTAPGPAHCGTFGTTRTMQIEVASADGKQLVKRSRPAGPLPGSEVVTAFAGRVSVPALKLCKARQPLRFTVTVVGLTASGNSRMHFAEGRCFLG
jgi:hypothetical protein